MAYASRRDGNNKGFATEFEIYVSEVKLNKIASMACRKAVKANDYLTQIEMEKLISDLRYIDNPFNCPHGRPIIIKFTEYELDKKFRRIV